MLELRNVTAGYGEHMVLHDVSLKAEQGSITTILGKNGCGKSTLLKTVTGLVPVSKGDIIAQDRQLLNLSRRDLAKTVAYLPQERSTPSITAGRYVLHGRFPHLGHMQSYSYRDDQIAMDAMAQMGICELADTPLPMLSGGMRQKVYIAMALAKQASVLLMDEPTAYLDIGQQMRFAHLVKEIAEQGSTVVLVLHDILYALKLSDCIFVMDDGSVIGSGTPDELLRANVLQELYGIEIGTVETEQGLRYYYK